MNNKFVDALEFKDRYEFADACEHARQTAKSKNRDIMVFYYAYSVKGGFYTLGDNSYKPSSSETLVACFRALDLKD